MEQFKAVFLMGVLLLFSFGCGKKPVEVKNLEVQTEVIENELWVDLKAELFLGSLPMSGLNLPIHHPQNLEAVGRVQIFRESQKNYLQLEMNISALSHLNLKNLLLPNGHSVPLMEGMQGIQLSLARGVTLYFYPALSSLKLGVSLNINQLDQIGQRVGETSLFPPFQIKDIPGAIGIYTGRARGQNGLGVFVDVSSRLSQLNQEKIDMREEMSGLIDSDLLVKEIPSARQMDALNQEMVKLYRKKVTLKVQ